MDGDNWTNSDNWFTDTLPWHGVVVSDGHVSALNLSRNNLVGALPPALLEFSNLQRVFFSFNTIISGALPSDVDRLQQLIFWNSAFNQLDGPIPDAFGDLPALQHLGLAGNNLSGDVPAAVIARIDETFTDQNNNGIYDDGEPFADANSNETFDGLRALGLGFNRLTVADENAAQLNRLAVNTFIDPQGFGGWFETQTLPPTAVEVTPVGSRTLAFSWQPFSLGTPESNYVAIISTDDPFEGVQIVRLPGIGDTPVEVGNFRPGVTYDVVMRMDTPAHES